ncbi:MAG: prepilin-type N-terminal cleavage/methylation domain-containing protein [Methylophagaceae bacterium]
MNTPRKQFGLTLIEMMIAMVLGLLVTGTIITIFVSNVKSSVENTKMIHLNQELRTVVGFMADELKRAGYSAAPTNAEYINDFDSPSTTCVTYAYDVAGNGASVANSDRFGFKLNGNTIEWGQNRTAKDNCVSGTWTAITDPQTADITNFSIDLSTAGSSVTMNTLVIAVTGEVSLNPDPASRTILETIRVRNEDAD